MQNRVTVIIADRKYAFLAAEDQSYMEQVAAHVDAQIKATLRADQNLSLLDGTVLTAVNLADDFLKEQENANRLRSQIKELHEESAKLKQELSEAKREIFKLQNGKGK